MGHSQSVPLPDRPATAHTHSTASITASGPNPGPTSGEALSLAHISGSNGYPHSLGAGLAPLRIPHSHSQHMQHAASHQHDDASSMYTAMPGTRSIMGGAGGSLEAALGAKDQRIHELRSALTATMAERSTLQKQVAGWAMYTNAACNLKRLCCLM